MSQSPVPPMNDPNAFAYVPPGPPLGPPPPKPPAWPLVIGIISTALGALALGCDIFGLIVAMVMTPFISKFTPQPAMPRMTFGPGSLWTVMSGGAQILTAAMLLIAGIALLRRRPAARALHLSYVVLEFALVLVSATVMVVSMQEAARAAATMPATSGPAMPAAAMKMGMVFGGVFGGFGMVLSMAYPVFLLVWFLRKRTIYDLRGWNARRP